MSNYWNNQVMIAATELSSIMNGSTIQIGTTGLLFPPVKIIFDNQGTVSVAVYVNGTAAANLWRTFPAGEALVLDDDLYAFAQGTIFYGNGASGTFSISYTYAKQ